MHVPLGVDTTLSDGSRADRPLTVLAYGRQPAPLMDLLSRAFNARGSPALHLPYRPHQPIQDPGLPGASQDVLGAVRAIRLLAGVRRLRRRSRGGRRLRFPFSLVGQRWFEALAAGCVVAGRRPTGEEAAELLDWPDATLELPSQPEAAVAQLLEWLRDPDRLRAIALRNAAAARAKHDWRHRLETIEPRIRELLGKPHLSPAARTRSGSGAARQASPAG